MRRLMYVLSVSFLMMNFNVKASHLVGTQASYKCLGGGNYELNFSLYMEPGGLNSGNIPVDSKMTISVIDLDNPNSPTLFDQFEIAKTSVETAKTSYTSKCSGTTYEDSMYLWNFKETVNLPANTNGYTVFYWRCCRPRNLMNVEDGNGLAIELNIPGSAIACNSSPEFNSAPIKMICSDEPINIDFSATDADGDSLIYRVAAPLAGGDDISNFSESLGSWTYAPPFGTVSYLPGFSGTNPFGNNDINMDANGVLSGSIASNGDYFVVGIEVDEYRNGQKIGTVRRDLPIVTVTCDRLEAIVQDSIAYVAPTCNPTVSFDNASINSTTLEWDFGDVSTNSDVSTSINPSYTYPGAGTYTVSLIATSDKYPNCKDTSHTVVTVSPEVNTDFSFTSICNSNKVDIKNISNLNGGTLANTTWSFENTTANTFDLFNNFNVAGAHTVKLKVESTDGCVDSISKTVTAGDKNVRADFAYNTVCNTNKAIFQDQSNYYNSTSKSYKWTFEGLNQSNKGIDSFTYAMAGSYTVQLIAESNEGCKDTISKTINVGGMTSNITLKADKNNVCEGETINFNAYGGFNYEYYLNGNLVSNSSNYSSSNLIDQDQLMVILEPRTNCADTANFTANIKSYPNYNTSIDTVCEGEKARIAINGNNIRFVRWSHDQFYADNYLDVATREGYIPMMYYFSVHSQDGCSINDSAMVGTIPGPNLSVTADQAVCKGNAATINATANTAFNIIHWNWSNGKNTAIMSVTPNSNTRFYLDVIDENGCTDTISSLIEVNEFKPEANTDTAKVCSLESVNFSSTNGNNPNWYDVNGNHIHNGSQYSYTPQSNEIIILEAQDPVNACIGKDTINVIVHTLPEVNAGANQEICEGGKAFIQPSFSSTAAIQSWNWNTGEQGQSLTVQPKSSTEYIVTVTDENECFDTSSTWVNISNYKPQLAPSAMEICEGESVILSIQDGANFRWINANEQIISNDQTIDFEPTQTGYYYIVADDENGTCVDGRDSVFITVNELQIAAIEDSLFICNGQEYTIQGNETEGVGRWYEIVDGKTEAIAKENKAAVYFSSLDQANRTFVWEVVDERCDTIATDTQIVQNMSTAIAATALVIDTLRSKDEYTFTASEKGARVNWYIDDELVSNETSYHKFFEEEGDYVLSMRVQNGFGCEEVRYKDIAIRKFSNIFLPNAMSLTSKENEFKPVGIFDDMVDYNMEIFNRWGEKVFETKDVEEGWNGLTPVSHKKSTQGNYYYKIEYTISGEESTSMMGAFLLMN